MVYLCVQRGNCMQKPSMTVSRFADLTWVSLLVRNPQDDDGLMAFPPTQSQENLQKGHAHVFGQILASDSILGVVASYWKESSGQKGEKV